jgi:uncharacterized protein (TIGR03435 family)
MRHSLSSIVAIVFVTSLGQAAQDLNFEVASVRPAGPAPGGYIGPPRGGPGTSDPGQIAWSSAALTDLLMTAYSKQIFQITGPAWLSTQRYDIVAKVPLGATPEQVRVMWQNLLKDRFGVALHHESKEFEVEELTVAKGGPKLKETDLPSDAEPFDPFSGSLKSLQTDKNGRPQMNGTGTMTGLAFGTDGRLAAGLFAKGLTLTELAVTLGQSLHQPVIDKTGITGRYDFTLGYTPDQPGGLLSSEASDPVANIRSAVEKQLGLKLTRARASLDVIIVDHAEKDPSAN